MKRASGAAWADPPKGAAQPLGRHTPWRPLAAGLALSFLLGTAALADQATTTASNANPNATVSASADLDFVLNIGKFLFFRVGTGAFPTASGTVDSVAFTLAPSIPAGGVTPVTGNNAGVAWSGALPGINVSGSNTVLPVEVRSNAGQISVRAAATTALTSGANSIPLSQITITSSDSNLPAPLVPNTGTGAAVNVTGTAFSNLVTVRSANWTFAYAPAAMPVAGAYTGQITFTASSP